MLNYLLFSLKGRGKNAIIFIAAPLSYPNLLVHPLPSPSAAWLDPPPSLTKQTEKNYRKKNSYNIFPS